MVTLTAIEKNELETDLVNNIVPVVGKMYHGREIDFSSAVRRAMSNQKNYFSGYPLNRIYQKRFSGSASKVYDYLIENFSGYLQSKGILKRTAPATPEPPATSAAPVKAKSMTLNAKLLIVLVVIGGFFVYKN